MKQQNWKLVLTPKANRKIFMIFKSNLSNNQYTIRFFHAIEKQFSYLDDSNLDISSRLWLLLKQQESSFSSRKKKSFLSFISQRLFRTVPKVHFVSKSQNLDFWHEKPQKPLFRVTYFLQISVGWILQITKIQSRSCQNLLFGQKLDF